jgi:hypothetical protein
MLVLEIKGLSGTMERNLVGELVSRGREWRHLKTIKNGAGLEGGHANLSIVEHKLRLPRI